MAIADDIEEVGAGFINRGMKKKYTAQCEIIFSMNMEKKLLFLSKIYLPNTLTKQKGETK